MPLRSDDKFIVVKTTGGGKQEERPLSELDTYISTGEQSELTALQEQVGNYDPAVTSSTITDDLEAIQAKLTDAAAVVAVAASKVLTVAATPAEGETVSIGGVTYKARLEALGIAVAATGILTSNNTEISDGDTVTIGTTVYQFKDTMAAAYDVKRDGTTADTTLANLVKAVNATGTAGVEYFAGTLIHPTVSAGAVTDHAITFTAKTAGAAGNAIAKAVSAGAAELDWDGTGGFLTGGKDAQAANDVYVDTNAQGFIDNLVLAITDTTNRAANIAAGKYGTGTVINPLATAVKASASTMTATAITAGVSGNLIAVAETLSNASSVWDNVGDSRLFLRGGIDGTVAVKGTIRYETTKLWIATDDCTIAVSNWHYASLT